MNSTYEFDILITEEVNPENNLSAKEYFDRGEEYFERKDYDKAIENYNKALQLEPNYWDAYFNLQIAEGEKHMIENPGPFFE